MKNLIALLVLGIFVVLGTGCNLDDDIIVDDPLELPEAVADFITENYPGFTIDSSEEEDLCDETPVLEVELEDGPGPDVDLYFTPNGQFLFVAVDITVAELPEVVRTTITTDFSDYSINPDDVERFEYPDGTVEYEVELVHNTTGEEDDAVFAADGTLICIDDSSDDDDDGDDDDGDDDDGDDDDGDDNGDDDDGDDDDGDDDDGDDDDGDDDDGDDDDGDDDDGDDDDGDDDDGDDDDLPEDTRGFISMNYPGYEIRSTEMEDICDDRVFYEVELEDGPGPDIELYFDLNWILQFTQTEISADELPDAVRAAITMNYSEFEIDEDEIERQEWVDGVLRFELELESEEDDLEIIFNADGTVYCLDD